MLISLFCVSIDDEDNTRMMRMMMIVVIMMVMMIMAIMMITLITMVIVIGIVTGYCGLIATATSAHPEFQTTYDSSL